VLSVQCESVFDFALSIDPFPRLLSPTLGSSHKIRNASSAAKAKRSAKFFKRRTRPLPAQPCGHVAASGTATKLSVIGGIDIVCPCRRVDDLCHADRSQSATSRLMPRLIVALGQ
jgi:hypothetical protein